MYGCISSSLKRVVIQYVVAIAILEIEQVKEVSQEEGQ